MSSKKNLNIEYKKRQHYRRLQETYLLINETSQLMSRSRLARLESMKLRGNEQPDVEVRLSQQRRKQQAVLQSVNQLYQNVVDKQGNTTS